MFRIFRRIFILAVIVVLAVSFYRVLATQNDVEFGRDVSGPITINLPASLSRLQMSKAIGQPLRWNEKEIESFAVVYAQIQWATFNREYLEIFSEDFEWNDTEREIFETSSAAYFKSSLDFSGRLYAAGVYEFEIGQSQASIASTLVDRIKEVAGTDLKSFISERINKVDRKKVDNFVENENELLPDLVPLPASDVVLEKSNGKTLLRFSTIYYNRGRGPLELRADPEAVDLKKDVDRDVYQRVYRLDGTYREKFSGNFLWHQEHLHYHFADFVTYDLEPVTAKNAPDLSGVLVKSTFCVRDISKVDLDLENTPADANYKICGKKIQGVSVGWADTYFFSYPDQSLDISDLPPGIYSLSFTVNPSKFLDEVSLENNVSSVLLDIDVAKKTVKVLEQDPENTPKVEHVYEDQVYD